MIKVVSKASLTLTNVDSQDELILQGLEHVLNDVVVEVSNPHFMYVGRPYAKGDLRHWPIGLKSVFWTEGIPGIIFKKWFFFKLIKNPEIQILRMHVVFFDFSLLYFN